MEEPIKLTLEELELLAAEVKRLIKENPLTVYPMVRSRFSDNHYYYTLGVCGEGAGCILGQASKVIPRLYEKLEEHDKFRFEVGRSATKFNTIVEPANRDNPDYVNKWYNTLSVLQTVQSHQDNPSTWEYCGQVLNVLSITEF